MLVGGYLALLVASPTILPWINKRVNHGSGQASSVPIQGNRIYIPKLNLNLAYAAGGEEVLKRGAWWRYPERGNPEKGGNFILAGHRFKLGITPYTTNQKSPFYHLNTMQPGDMIYVDYNDKRYAYKVIKNYTVPPTQVQIEAPSKTAKMTLYTCTLEGAADGREVLDAAQTASNIDRNQKL